MSADPRPTPPQLDDAAILALGRETFRQEAAALAAIGDGLDRAFVRGRARCCWTAGAGCWSPAWARAASWPASWPPP